MENIIEIKKLNFGYKDKMIFENFNLNIKKNSFTTIIGPSGSGKNTLAKLLLEKNNTNSISFNGSKSIFHVFYDERKKGRVIDEICNKLKIEKPLVEKIGKKLKIEEILYKKINELSIDERQYISLIEAFVLKPEVIILNTTLGYLDHFNKEKILKILKKINATIIHITNDVEDILIGNHVIILNSGKLVFNDKTETILINKKTLKSVNLDNPFMINLSERLKLYELINKTYYKKEELVDALWK